MKRFVAIALILLITLSSLPLAVAEHTEEQDCYEIMTELVTLHPHRKAGTEGEKKTAEYIESFFKGCGYAPYIQSFSYGQADSLFGEGEPTKSCNVIAKKDSNSSKTVVIGAHYDNVFSSGNGQGAYDNGSGVGIMLALSKRLADVELDFNVEFVAFGAEEAGLIGSRHYVDYLTATERDSIVLYVNLDSILAGDELYMYSDEVKTIHGDYFARLVDELSLSIRQMPEVKGSAGVFTEGDKLPYTHPAISTDVKSFLNAGIPSVSFSSFVVEREYLEQVNESMRFDNVMHTEKDNIQKIESLYGEEAREKMESVYALLTSALLREDFLSVMTDARKNNPDYSALADGSLGGVISIIIIGEVSVALIIFYGIISKKAERERKRTQKSVPPTDIFPEF